MKLEPYEEPNETGADFVVSIERRTQEILNKDDTLDKALMTVRNAAFEADSQFKRKDWPVNASSLFRVKNEAGKMFYYGANLVINLEQKTILFVLTHSYTKNDFIQATIKKKAFNENAKKERESREGNIRFGLQE